MRRTPSWPRWLGLLTMGLLLSAGLLLAAEWITASGRTSPAVARVPAQPTPSEIRPGAVPSPTVWRVEVAPTPTPTPEVEDAADSALMAPDQGQPPTTGDSPDPANSDLMLDGGDDIDWSDIDWENIDWDDIDWENIDWDRVDWDAFGAVFGCH